MTHIFIFLLRTSFLHFFADNHIEIDRGVIVSKVFLFIAFILVFWMIFGVWFPSFYPFSLPILTQTLWQIREECYSVLYLYFVHVYGMTFCYVSRFKFIFFLFYFNLIFGLSILWCKFLADKFMGKKSNYVLRGNL